MKKLRVLLSFVAILGIVGFIVSCDSMSVQAEDSYVTIDINPSVELIVSPYERVVSANPLNADAEVLLEGLDLIGMPVDEAVDLIIETSIELGYISVDEAIETYVSISTISPDEALQAELHVRVKNAVNNAFMNRGLKGRAQDKAFTDDFILEAESYGVTPEFLFLAYQAVELSDDLLLDDALLLTEAELVEIITEARDALRTVLFELRDQFHAERDLLVETYQPQLEALELSIASVEAEMEALEEGADPSVLEAELDALLADLEALQTEFHDQMAALRDTYLEQASEIRDQIHDEMLQRQAEHREAVEQFVRNMHERRDRMHDAVEDFQGEEPVDEAA